ncbi:hypothetical protein [Oribacterium sinus]|nr:hypothetical protein [Oribacterium sinus]
MSQTALRESREKGEWKSRVGQISLKGRGEEERNASMTVHRESEEK